MTTAEPIDVQQLVWEKPGAGQWAWDGSHLPGAPTPMQQAFHFPNMMAGIEAMFERYGIPLRTFAYRVVNGKVYSRLLPLVGAESDRKPPPGFVIKVTARVHPEFRKRAANARRLFAERLWREDMARWEQEHKAAWRAANLRFQAVDVAGLDDAALATHVRSVFDHVGRGHFLHFELHGADMAPLGDLIFQCRPWGISAHEVLGLLQGASPASASAARAVDELAQLVAGAAVPPASLEDVRAISPRAADALDAYLAEYGWRIVTNYDVDGRCLVEMPDALLTSLKAGAPKAKDDPAATAAATATLRERVPAAERSTFDDLLAEARLVYGLRDDNGPLTIAWPIGLLRRAVLEAGRRLAARCCLADPEHAVELDVDELASLLTTGHGPSADEVSARGARRAVLAALRPPATLGDPEPEPPLAQLPADMARAATLAMTAVASLDAPAQRAPMEGLGIGTATYVGKARVARASEDVLDDLEPGEILVAKFTNPAYNALFFVAGAVVTEEGGPLAHAAVMARELGIPAVVGVLGALDQIHDGDTVEVDPVSGKVQVLALA